MQCKNCKHVFIVAALLSGERLKNQKAIKYQSSIEILLKFNIIQTEKQVYQ